MCIVNGLVPDPATTVINGQSVCSKHINDVIAAPGSQGLTISRMKPDSIHACVACGHHQRVHLNGNGCAAGVGGGELCSCTAFTGRQ
jgi:hypothetical protein